MPVDVAAAAAEGIVAETAGDAAQRSRCSAPGRRLCPSSTRRLRSISRTSGTRSGVVQSPSMKDSPRPMSPPVSARRKNRSSWTVSVASSSPSSPNRYVRSGHSTVSVPPFRPARPERNAVFAHCVTMLITPSHESRPIGSLGRMRRTLADAVRRDARHDAARPSTRASAPASGCPPPPSRSSPGCRSSARRISLAFQGRRSSDSVASKPTTPARPSPCARRARLPASVKANGSRRRPA